MLVRLGNYLQSAMDTNIIAYDFSAILGKGICVDQRELL
jgi:hypothetical protein